MTHTGSVKLILTPLAVVLVSFFSITPSISAGPVVTENDKQFILDSGVLTVTIDKARNGVITSMISNRNKRELVSSDPEARLFRLIFTHKGDTSGKTVVVDNMEAKSVTCEKSSNGSKASAILHFSELGGKNIEAQCTATVSENDSLVLWNISVKCDEPLILEEVEFPIVVLADKLGETQEDDAFLAGATQDGLFLAPGNWRMGKKQAYSQPGSLTAQFGCYYDPQGGIYTASRDGKGYPKRFTTERVSRGLKMHWTHLTYHSDPQPFELPYGVNLGVFRSNNDSIATDWRDAADLYKQWAKQQPWCAKTVVQRKDIPDWIKKGCVRMQWNLRSDGTPDLLAEWVDKNWRKHFGSLPPFVTLFGFEHVADWVAPKYFPFYPSDEAFKDATRRIKEQNGHVFLFPSGYKWTVTYNKKSDGSFEWSDREDFEKTALPHTMRNRDGSPVLKADSWLRGGQNAALCRGDAWSRQLLTDSMLQMLDRGVDMLQMDQVVGGQWPAGARSPCFSSDHGHPPGYGLWDVNAFHEQMKDLREQCDRKMPDVVFSMENPQELFIQDFGILDYRHARANVNVNIWDLYPRQHAPAFPYLYNEFVPVFYIPTHTEPVGIILAEAIISGEIPGFKVEQIEFPGTPAISNGDFEKWSEKPAGWNVWQSDPDTRSEVHPGPGAEDGTGRALWIEDKAAKKSTMVYQCIPVDGSVLKIGESYQLRLRLTSENVKGSANANLAALTSPNWWEWKELKVWKADLKPDTAWEERLLPFTIPEGCTSLRIALNLSDQGKVAFDDFVFEQVSADGKTVEVARQGNSVYQMLHQYAGHMERGAGKYTMLGTMIHPPLMETVSTSVTVSKNKAADLSFQLYTLKKDAGKYVTTSHTSCPLTISSDDGKWEHKSLEMTITSGSTEFHIPMSLRQKGEILFDDFELTEVGGKENLLKNPGFEEWPDSAASPPHWSHIKEYAGRQLKGTVHCETKDVHSGKYAICLKNTSDDDLANVKQVLPVDGKQLTIGKTYKLSFWAKSRGISRWQPVNVEKKFPAIIHNAFRAPDGQEAVLMVNITDQTQEGEFKWHGRQHQFKMQPWQVEFLEDPVKGSK